MTEDPRNNGKKTGPGNPPVQYQFKPGNPGRPKGARNKLGEAFIEDLLSAWESQGPAVIQTVIRDKPEAFLKVVASLMPKDLNVNMNQLDEMTDDQLIRRIRTLDAAIRPFLDAEGAGGASRGTGSQAAH